MKGRAFLATGLLSLAGAAPAHGLVTVGQVAPGGFTPDTCGPSSGSFTQPTVTSGPSFVIPAAGRIVSWSTRTTSNASQRMALKIMRPLGGSNYLVTTHDGPRDLTASAVSTFSTSLSVRAGDILGVSTTGTGNLVGCSYQVPGETIWGSFPEEPDDGEQAMFFSSPNRRLNLSAVLEPSNDLAIKRTRRNKKKGTATITVSVAGPGTVALGGKGLKSRRKQVVAPTGGLVKLKVIAKGNAAGKLRRRGRARVTPRITFTPTGGAPARRSDKVKLLLS